jgi:alanyl-tRNA synthetase
MDANRLRRAFTGFFAERDHTVVPSSGLIPHHPLAPLFSNAGMNQFLPYFLGEEAPPYPRATSVQKCVRIRGKHDDIELIGRTTRHLSFFEMLGNFSFGDYFKAGAIPYAWELLTEVLGLDGDRLWATVYVDDDEAADIWRDAVGLPAERIQRMRDDNFWEMGETGPCGPSSEIFFDKGAEHGAPGGPRDGGEERYVEIWNLVFMQFDRQGDGTLDPLPKCNIDTGAGLERILPILQGHSTVWDTDELRLIIGAAEQVTGRRYGDDDASDVALRMLADHSRTMTFLVNDGVIPSNEDRGYVLRRIIRRAVRQAYQLGVERQVTPALVTSTIDVMGDAYPDLERNRDFVGVVVQQEEERFRQTLRTGLALLDEVVASGTRSIPGPTAFHLHDTLGFPIELTREIATERGIAVDVEGFDAEMEQQRRRAKDAARKVDTTGAGTDVYRKVLDEFGPTEFVGYAEVESKARVVAMVGEHLFLDRTPFYAEGGGQVGDTGTVSTDTGRAEVHDTTYALPGLIAHHVRVLEGELSPGQEAVAAIDAARRDAIRRNHTGTHIVHWALREVLGTHVKQAGSLVAPDRLRFDFSHYGPVTPEELGRVEALANERVLANEPVRAYETSKDEAERIGAIAFFGDKYGDFVRVVEAGGRSIELCGGTHVDALGTIGPITIVSEASIGANLRRIEALTGEGSLARFRHWEDTLNRAASLLRVTPDEVPERIEKALEERRAIAQELEQARRQAAGGDADRLAMTAVDGVVVARRDGGSRDELRELAVVLRDRPGMRAVVLGGAPDGGGVALVAATTKESGLVASELIAEAARTVGGGVGKGKSPELSVTGGKDVAKLDEALDRARAAAGIAGGA